MVDTLSPQQRSWNMSRIKCKDTKPELLLRSRLHKKGFRFRTNDKRLQGKPDIVLPKYKTAIFVNGCFWHRHSGCRYAYTPKSRQKFWLNKFEETIHRDQKKRNQLRKNGWSVLTIWECKINQDCRRVAEGILLKLSKRRINE